MVPTSHLRWYRLVNQGETSLEMLTVTDATLWICIVFLV